jgi:AcrR family transcriptional regulator
MVDDTHLRPNRGGKDAGAYHHGDLRRALMDAALAEVERVGPDLVNLSGLAKSLGVSQPAPYRHFADREALLAAVAARGFESYDAALDEAVASGSRFAAPTRIAAAHVSFGLAHPGLYRLMFAPYPAAEDHGGEAAFARLLEAVRAIGYGQGARRRALRIWAAAHGLIMLAGQPGFGADVAGTSLTALIDDIVA